jgi:transposase
LLGKKSAASFFCWEIIPLTEDERTRLPDPPNGHRRQTHRLVYSFDQSAAEADARHDGIYALVTTAPTTCSGDALFSEYKRQTHVEREHHELKTPLAVAPIFLKTPRRVEALVHLLFLALQAYMTLERLYRQTAQPSERRMTAEKILKKFSICALIVDQQAYGECVHAARLTRVQRAILTQLSLPTPTEILRKNLPPTPSP